MFVQSVLKGELCICVRVGVFSVHMPLYHVCKFLSFRRMKAFCKDILQYDTMRSAGNCTLLLHE